MSEPVAICIVAHESYLQNLNLILTIWNTFAPNHWRKIISLDGCQFDNSRFPEWEVIENEWMGKATRARNAALAKLERGYVVFWDSDNVPTKEYVDAIERVSTENSETFCWYPDMYLPYEPTDLRFCNYIDTASVLRVECLKTLGGWSEVPCLQDWDLHLKARAHGFKAERLNARFVYCRHPESISASYSPSEEIPWIRSVGIICPMRGDKTLSGSWLRSLSNHKLPSRTGVTIVDKSGSTSFGRWIKSQLLSLDMYRVTYIVDDPVPSDSFFDIHNSVGKSYALALPSTPEDLILTWEDDVTPLSQTALTELIQNIFPLQPYHVIGAHVPTRENPEQLIATWGRERWEGHINSDLDTVCHIGMIGGGFTLWHRTVLEEFGFQGSRFIDDFPLGWDGWLCHRINQKYRIGLAPIKCLHER